MIQSFLNTERARTVKSIAARLAPRPNGEANKLSFEDRSVHDWYRFVLSFPPHLVRTYLSRFGVTERQRVPDPFCGTGTTIVECKKLGIPSLFSLARYYTIIFA
jgi:tRNA G10  N-methylase Trm11